MSVHTATEHSGTAHSDLNYLCTAAASTNTSLIIPHHKHFFFSSRAEWAEGMFRPERPLNMVDTQSYWCYCHIPELQEMGEGRHPAFTPRHSKAHMHTHSHPCWGKSRPGIQRHRLTSCVLSGSRQPLNSPNQRHYCIVSGHNQMDGASPNSGKAVASRVRRTGKGKRF
jgi:hypothetical protein